MNILGLDSHPTKGYHTTTQAGEQLGMEMDFEQGVFRAPVKKLKGIPVFAKNILCMAASSKRWVTVKALATMARKAQFMHLVILVARFYFRELYDAIPAAK
jgi:hypothetical protein